MSIAVIRGLTTILFFVLAAEIPGVMRNQATCSGAGGFKSSPTRWMSCTVS
jgi:hypothetical protein